MIAATIFIAFESNLLPKKSGIVLELIVCVITRVLLPRISQGSKEPMIALPIPTQVAATPNKYPN